jgi:hypothetical protein
LKQQAQAMWAETFDPINIDGEITKSFSLKTLAQAWKLIREPARTNTWKHLTDI